MSENENMQLDVTNETTDLVVPNRSEMYISDIKKANLLPPDKMERLVALSPELEHIFKTQTIWRSETEIRCSVLNDMNFPDNASKYHQAKLEQMVFADQLLHLSFDYEKLKNDLDIVDAEIEEITDQLDNITLKSFEVKKLKGALGNKEVEKKRLLYGIEHMHIQAKERMREIETWSKIKAELDDGSFDKDLKDTNQLVSMTRRYVQEGFNCINNGKNSDISSYNNIVAQFKMLTKECYNRGMLPEVLSMFPQSLIDWVYGVTGIPKPENIVRPIW